MEPEVRIVAMRVGRRVVCERCRLADTFWSRLRGLMGRGTLTSEEGMMLRPASAIHTCFMRFPIDAVFLDPEDRVLELRERLKPWRTASVRGASTVLELPGGAGRVHEIEIGEKFAIEESR